MGKKHVKQFRQRYLSDIVARWKNAEGNLHEATIQNQLDTFRKQSGVTEYEYESFLVALEDELFQSESQFYEEKIRYGHETLPSMRVYVEHTMTSFRELKPRLLALNRRWQQERDNQLLETQIQAYQTLLTTGQTTLEDLYDRVEAEQLSRAVKRRLYATIELWARTKQGPMKGLADLAKDNQNIHTFAVSNATKDMLLLLQEIPVPTNQSTLKEIQQAWITYPNSETVVQDMRSWANCELAYRSALRSVWAKIKVYVEEPRKELSKRLYEECTEAVGMCAQGHMSRLANVFVGFDERFLPTETESLQDKMANLSLLDISEEQKKERARQILEERKVPQEEHQAWLDALES